MTFFKRSAILEGKQPFCVVEAPWGLRSNVIYDDHLRLIGKRVVDFLLVLIDLFSLGVTAEALRPHNINVKELSSLQRLLRMTAANTQN